MYQRVGTAFGKYQVRRVLGVGGMATVYYALASDASHPIALKILSAQYTDIPSFRQRFEFEAHLTALLAHPHIVPVLDYGAVGYELFLAMPYMAGGSLHDRFVLEGAISLQETARILGQLADALDYAHAQGVIHRDLKLANVLLDDQRDTRLSDFGIARLAESNLHLTDSGSVLGSPHYMSPEQTEGGPLDARSDLYALAVMVYLMITGQFPFHADTALAIALQHLHKTPLPPTALAPELPFALDAVLLKGLAKLPAHRFDSAASFYHAFVRALGTFDTRTQIRVAQLSGLPAPSSTNGHNALYKVTASESSASPLALIDNAARPLASESDARNGHLLAEPMIAIPHPNDDRITPIHTPLLAPRRRRAPLLIGAVASLGIIVAILVISFTHLLGGIAGNPTIALTPVQIPTLTLTTAALVNPVNPPITATHFTSLIFATNTPNIVIPLSPKFVAISQSLNNPVNVRAGPDKAYAVVAQLRPKDQGVILARTTDASPWYLISVNGSLTSIGWVWGKVIDVLPTESDTRQIATAITLPPPPTATPTLINPKTPTVPPRG